MDETENTVETENTGTETVEETGPASAVEAIDQALGYAEAPAELDAAGKPLEKAAPEAKPALDANGKPVVADKKAPDYTPPAGLNRESTRRFQELTSDNKAVRAENEQLKAKTAEFEAMGKDVAGFREIFSDAKVQPAQFGLAVDFIKAVNTGNFDRAIAIITTEMRNLTLATGRDLNTPDPLADFPDLAQAVTEGKATRQHALELARSRTNEAGQRQSKEAQQATEKQQQDWDKAVNTGGAEVAAWEAQKKASDIDFPAKAAALDKELDWLAQNVHPTKWVAHLEKFYALMGAGRPAPQQQTPAKSPQPLRANGGAGGAKPAPTSMLEAIEQGLKYETA